MYILDDIFDLEDKLEFENFSDLGSGIYKYRIKNSSIPVGKRGGFRLIAKVYQNKFLPLLIYSKTQKDNVNNGEIVSALDVILKEL